MGSVINNIVAILMLTGLVSAAGPVYQAIKKEAVLKVHGGLHPLEGFTRKLTGTKLKY